MMPMFVRSRPSRTRRTISLSWARSDSTTKSTARPSAGRASGEPTTDTSVPPARITPADRVLDFSADDIEHQVDAADVFQRVVLQVDELHRAEDERLLPVGGAPGADYVRAGLTCELVLVECKRLIKDEKELQAAVAQAHSYALWINPAYYVITDGRTVSVWDFQGAVAPYRELLRVSQGELAGSFDGLLLPPEPPGCSGGTPQQDQPHGEAAVRIAGNEVRQPR